MDINPVLSLVIPIYNEIDTLPVCLSRIATVMQQLLITYELIIIDDGSNDGSFEYLLEKRAEIKQINIVRLSRNFGKESALTAGIDYARGSAVIILDADCQDPPELIPEMLSEWRKGADVVLMQRRSRVNETRMKRISAYIYYRLLNYLSECDIPPDTGDFRLLSHKAINAIRQLSENNRYMKGLFAWVGMKTHVVYYEREPRSSGSTKWPIFSLFGLAIQGITSFSIMPLRYATLLGLITSSIGLFYGCLIVMKTLILGEAVRGYTSLISIITLLGGIQLLCIGILGEYVGKTYRESKRRPNYLILDEVGFHFNSTCKPNNKLFNHTEADLISSENVELGIKL